MKNPTSRFRTRFRMSAPRLVGMLAVLLASLSVGSVFAMRTLVGGTPAGPMGVRVTLRGVPVDITYDAQGMAHITAPNELAGYAALGWISAEQRLWQLDELRRGASGTLAAVLGAGPGQSILQQDELFAVLDLPGAAQQHYAQLDPQQQALLAAYAAGVNAWASTHPLPLEFGDLHARFAPWQPWDAELIGMYLTTSLDLQVLQTKLTFGALAAAGGPDLATTLIPESTGPTMFDASGALNDPAALATAHMTGPSAGSVGSVGMAGTQTAAGHAPSIPLGTAANALADLPATHLGGSLRASNNLVISGRLSATGLPLLANDPHLQFEVPALLLPMELRVTGGPGAQHVAGFVVPGTPYFLIGHTDTIAWGVTFGQLDDLDLYVETTRTVEGQLQTRYADEWVPVEHRAVTILVAGGQPVTLMVQRTPHGPILNAALPALDASGLISIKQALSQSAWRADGFSALPLASDFPTFQAALAHISIGLNVLYADIHDTIGYQLTGLVPIRASAENVFAPVPGGDGQHEWTGYAPFSALPHVINPAAGFLLTANNAIVPDDYAPEGVPLYYSRYWDVSDRAARMTTLVLQLAQGGRHKLTLADIERIQRDTVGQEAQATAQLLVAAVGRTGLPAGDPMAAASLVALRAWDGDVSATSTGALVYEAWLAYLMRDTLSGVVGSGYSAYASSVFITTQLQVVRDLLAQPTPPFFVTPNARDVAVQQALAEADAAVRSALGHPPADATWGELHTMTYAHPLAASDPRFAIGTYPTDGDATTVNTGGWFLSQEPLLALPSDQLAAAGGLRAAFARDAIATARVIWDVADWSASPYVLSVGVSGTPGPHYADQAPLWRSGDYLTFPFTA